MNRISRSCCLVLGRPPSQHARISTAAASRTWRTVGGSLLERVEQEYVHVRVALEASPNADDLQMRLKRIGGVNMR